MMMKEKVLYKNKVFNDPILIDTVMIKELCAKVGRLGDRLEISVKQKNDVSISNMSFEDLIECKNYEDEKIEFIDIKGGEDNYSKWLEIKIGKDYRGNNIRVDIKSTDYDNLLLLDTNIQRILSHHKHDRRYMSMINNSILRTILSILLLIIAVEITVCYFSGGKIDVISMVLNEYQQIVFLKMLGIFIIYYFFEFLIRIKYYKPLVIAIGKEKKYDELKEKRIGIFVGVLGGGIIQLAVIIWSFISG